MNLLSALCNVMANLREGRDPAAVRTDRPVPPSPEYIDRMATAQLTERYVASLSGRIPQPLLPALQESTAHAPAPLLDLRALADHVASHRQALSVTIHRAGVTPSPREARHLAALAELQPVLERLAAESAPVP